MRILVVEREPAVLDLLCQTCGRDGHEVVRATSGTEALVRLRTTPVEALVTDIAVPGLDGLALLRRARALQPDILSIVITGTCCRHTLDDVLGAGASDILLKPVRAPELLARLKLIEGRRRQADALTTQTRALEAASRETVHALQREMEELRLQTSRLLAQSERGDVLV